MEAAKKTNRNRYMYELQWKFKAFPETYSMFFSSYKKAKLIEKHWDSELTEVATILKRKLL